MEVGVIFNKDSFQFFSTTAHRAALMGLLFRNIPYTGIGNAGGLLGSAANGDMWLSLHTDTPGLDGTQATNEVTYPGYGRIAAPRDPVSANYWTIFTSVAVGGSTTLPLVGYPFNNKSNFPVCGATANGYRITHVGVGVAAAGATDLLAYRPMTRPIYIVQGQAPLLDTQYAFYMPLY